jgi:hypothetical protein
MTDNINNSESTQNLKAPEASEFGPYDDGAFLVRRQRWGTYVSRAPEGTEALITSLTLEACVDATRQHLKWRQDGADGTGGGVSAYDGVVGGKL